MIYLDTSALVKLVFEEAESAALAGWLGAREVVPKISSEVATIELLRTCRRRAAATEPDARQLLRGLDLVPLSADVIERAALVGPSELRSLDAVHLASALSLADGVDAFVAYDVRLRAAAETAGLPVAAPGRGGWLLPRVASRV